MGIVALFVGAALALSLAADSLFARLQPDLYRQVGEISESLFNPAGLSAAGAVLFALLVGVGAGLGEETLFRGAVQPKLGIAATSVLFASMVVSTAPRCCSVTCCCSRSASGCYAAHQHHGQLPRPRRGTIRSGYSWRISSRRGGGERKTLRVGSAEVNDASLSPYEIWARRAAGPPPRRDSRPQNAG